MSFGKKITTGKPTIDDENDDVEDNDDDNDENIQKQDGPCDLL